MVPQLFSSWFLDWFPCWCPLLGFLLVGAAWMLVLVLLVGAAWMLVLVLLVGGGDEVCEGLETGWIQFDGGRKG